MIALSLQALACALFIGWGCLAAVLLAPKPGSEGSRTRKTPLLWGLFTGLSAAIMFVISWIYGGNSGGTDSIINLGIGLVGLVITALTGMALATAWRALDDARSANLRASRALGEIDGPIQELHEKIMQTNVYFKTLQDEARGRKGASRRKVQRGQDSTTVARDKVRTLLKSFLGNNPSREKSREAFLRIYETDQGPGQLAAVTGGDGFRLVQLCSRQPDLTVAEKVALGKLLTEFKHLGYGDD